MDVGLSGGADDVISNEDGSIEVIASPNDFNMLKSVFDEANLSPEVSEVTHKATTVNTLEGEEAEKMQKLIDALEALDDVQDVYTTAEYDV
jgi:transcriptional/translational regulatory protein YebC/TACO1